MKIGVISDTHDQYENILKDEKIKGASFAVYDTKTNTAKLIKL